MNFVDQLREHGFAFAPVQPELEREGLVDWDGFAKSWDDLGVDTYMADGGRYRKRRFGAFSAGKDGVVRKPHQPHYQSRDYNTLNGGVARWFSAITDEVAAHPAMQASLRFCHRLFDSLSPPGITWHVEVHQFRIETGPEVGQPTPEGMHRDGVDWVMVMLVHRENITSGETRIADTQLRPIGSFTLTHPMDAAFTDDDRVFHGVTPLGRIDPSKSAHRDVLVVTFRRS